MTGAERVRLYRLKHAAAKPVPKPTADNVAHDRRTAEGSGETLIEQIAAVGEYRSRWRPTARRCNAGPIRNRARVIDRSWRD
jgi:hypothetical protein